MKNKVTYHVMVDYDIVGEIMDDINENIKGMGINHRLRYASTNNHMDTLNLDRQPSAKEVSELLKIFRENMQDKIIAKHFKITKIWLERKV